MRDLDELEAQLSSGRRTVTTLADQVGAAAVAMPTPVLSDDDADDITREPRYERIKELSSGSLPAPHWCARCTCMSRSPAPTRVSGRSMPSAVAASASRSECQSAVLPWP